LVGLEYGIVPVLARSTQPRAARRPRRRDGPFGGYSIRTTSTPSPCDHQLAHVYLNGIEGARCASCRGAAGVDRLVEPGEVELDHPRSVSWGAAQPDAWFAYPYWLDDARARLRAASTSTTSPASTLRAVHHLARAPILRLAQKALASGT
jgi:hypothetical protein